MEILWKVIELAIAPTLIVGALAFVMRELFKSYLSMDIERYKSQLQNDLETHKISLKAEYDLKHFEFQTRFSYFHQKQASAITDLYEILIDLGKQVEHAHYWGDNEDREKKYKEAQNKYHEYIEFYLKNQIYFDDNLCERIEEVRDLANQMIDRYIASSVIDRHSRDNKDLLPKSAEAGIQELDTHKEFRVKFPELRKRLRNELRQILSAHQPNKQFEKKQ